MKRDNRVVRPEEVIEFWFGELSAENWFSKDDALDAQIAARFEATHLALARHVAPEWRGSPEARLAAVLVFDQFPRNIYRDTPHSFATDCLALRETGLALEAGADKAVDADKAAFFYMPLMHSEVMADQDMCVEVFTAHGNENYLKYAHAHRDLITKFGRFPHRNAILARESTPAEKAYLAQPGSGF